MKDLKYKIKTFLFIELIGLISILAMHLVCYFIDIDFSLTLYYIIPLLLLFATLLTYCVIIPLGDFLYSL